MLGVHCYLKICRAHAAVQVPIPPAFAMRYTEGYRKKLSKASTGDSLAHEYLTFVVSSSGHQPEKPGDVPWISFGLPSNTHHIRKTKNREIAKPIAPNDKLSNALFVRETKRAWAAFKARAAAAVRAPIMHPPLYVVAAHRIGVRISCLAMAG